jgi:hypothetical protein
MLGVMELPLLMRESGCAPDGTGREGPCRRGGLLLSVNGYVLSPVYLPGVTMPHQLRFYALTYPFGFSTNFVAEPASNSA